MMCWMVFDTHKKGQTETKVFKEKERKILLPAPVFFCEFLSSLNIDRLQLLQLISPTLAGLLLLLCFLLYYSSIGGRHLH